MRIRCLLVRIIRSISGFLRRLSRNFALDDFVRSKPFQFSFCSPFLDLLLQLYIFHFLLALRSHFGHIHGGIQLGLMFDKLSIRFGLFGLAFGFQYCSISIDLGDFLLG